MKNKTIKQTKKIALMLGIGALNGSIAIAALAGMFKLSNIPVIATAFMAGPGALITAALSEGNIKERILSAAIAGIIATVLVTFAAGFGPKILGFLNINILKASGAIAVFVIALLIGGLKINENIPLFIIIIGLITSLIWR